MVEAFDRVAQHGCHLVQIALATHDNDDIAHLQAQFVRCHEFDTGTDNARYGNVVVLADVQIADTSAIELRLGNHDASFFEIRGSRVPLLVGKLHLLADQRLYQLFIATARHHSQNIVFVQHGIFRSDFLIVILAHDTRHNEFGTGYAQQICHALADHRTIGYAQIYTHRMRRIGLLVGSRFIFDFYAECDPDEEYRDDYADHSEGICHRIGRCQQVAVAAEVVDGLLRRTQPRGIGNCARQNPDHGGQALARQHMDSVTYRASEQYEQGGKHIQPQTLLLQRCKETGTYLQTDGIDEQNQAELLDECTDAFIDDKSEMGQQNADKKHPRYPERYRTEFDTVE